MKALGYVKMLLKCQRRSSLSLQQSFFSVEKNDNEKRKVEASSADVQPWFSI